MPFPAVEIAPVGVAWVGPDLIGPEARAWRKERMRIIRCLLVLGLVAATARAAETFSDRLTAEEAARAGLRKLTPAERAALDALVQKYGGPASAGVSTAAAAPAPTAPPPVAAPAAPAVPARPAAPVPGPAVATAAPAPAAAPADEPPPKKSFLRRAKKDPAKPAKPAPEVIESEIDGSFTGWEETTVWTLKDGSIWRVDNRPRPYFTNRIANPKVKIYPALMNGFWLEIPDLDIRVRVVRLQ
jgi:hypothetical protein